MLGAGLRLQLAYELLQRLRGVALDVQVLGEARKLWFRRHTYLLLLLLLLVQDIC
jgi:hypothetical protein